MTTLTKFEVSIGKLYLNYYDTTKTVKKEDQNDRDSIRSNYECQYIQKLTTNYGPLYKPVVHHQLTKKSSFLRRNTWAMCSYDLMYVTLVAVERAFSRIQSCKSLNFFILDWVTVGILQELLRWQMQLMSLHLL